MEIPNQLHHTKNAIMRKLLFISILFGILGCNNPNKKTANHDRSLTILTHGLPDFGRQQAEIVVAAQYGFKFKSVAGCVISEALSDSIDIKNRLTEAILAQKYGKEWKLRFYAEVDSILQKQTPFQPSK